MKEAGDVMGMFVGHDHDNDYDVMWKGILLAYGRFTGGNTEDNHLSNGARVIVMKEGARTFTTWIRLKGKRTHFLFRKSVKIIRTHFLEKLYLIAIERIEFICVCHQQIQKFLLLRIKNCSDVYKRQTVSSLTC